MGRPKGRPTTNLIGHEVAALELVRALHVDLEVGLESPFTWPSITVKPRRLDWWLTAS